jgi:hypothetical protein
MSTHAPVGGPAMKPTPALIILMIASLLAPSARSADRFPTRDQLNDPGRGVWSDDTADVLKPRQLIYEAKEDGRYRVSYNLIREVGGDVKGYFARLTIRNLSENTVVAATDVTLIDAESSVISATDRDTFRALAATLADTKAPAARRHSHHPPMTTYSKPFFAGSPRARSSRLQTTPPWAEKWRFGRIASG